MQGWSELSCEGKIFHVTMQARKAQTCKALAAGRACSYSQGLSSEHTSIAQEKCLDIPSSQGEPPGMLCGLSYSCASGLWVSLDLEGTFFEHPWSGKLGSQKPPHPTMPHVGALQATQVLYTALCMIATCTCIFVQSRQSSFHKAAEISHRLSSMSQETPFHTKQKSVLVQRFASNMKSMIGMIIEKCSSTAAHPCHLFWSAVWLERPVSVPLGN